MPSKPLLYGVPGTCYLGLKLYFFLVPRGQERQRLLRPFELLPQPVPFVDAFGMLHPVVLSLGTKQKKERQRVWAYVACCTLTTTMFGHPFGVKTSGAYFDIVQHALLLQYQRSKPLCRSWSTGDINVEADGSSVA